MCPKCIRKETLLGRDLSKIGPISAPISGPSYDYIRTNDPNLARWVYHYYAPALKLLPSSFNTDTLITALKKHSIEVLPKSNEYLVEQYGYKIT
jgi:hypothetical protein